MIILTLKCDYFVMQLLEEFFYYNKLADWVYYTFFCNILLHEFTKQVLCMFTCILSWYLSVHSVYQLVGWVLLFQPSNWKTPTYWSPIHDHESLLVCCVKKAMSWCCYVENCSWTNWQKQIGYRIAKWSFFGSNFIWVEYEFKWWGTQNHNVHHPKYLQDTEMFVPSTLYYCIHYQ